MVGYMIFVASIACRGCISVLWKVFIIRMCCGVIYSPSGWACTSSWGPGSGTSDYTCAVGSRRACLRRPGAVQATCPLCRSNTSWGPWSDWDWRRSENSAPPFGVAGRAFPPPPPLYPLKGWRRSVRHPVGRKLPHSIRYDTSRPLPNHISHITAPLHLFNIINIIYTHTSATPPHVVYLPFPRWTASQV